MANPFTVCSRRLQAKESISNEWILRNPAAVHIHYPSEAQLAQSIEVWLFLLPLYDNTLVWLCSKTANVNKSE